MPDQNSFIAFKIAGHVDLDKLNMFSVYTQHLSLIVFEIKDEKLTFLKFDEKRAITSRWVIRFTLKLQVVETKSTTK